MTAKEASEALANADKKVVKVNDTLHVFLFTDKDRAATQDKIDKLVGRSLRAGKVVEVEGVTKWIEAFERFDPDKSGSACYTWHADGNRVLADRFLFTRTRNASGVDTLTREDLGARFIRWRP